MWQGESSGRAHLVEAVGPGRAAAPAPPRPSPLHELRPWRCSPTCAVVSAASRGSPPPPPLARRRRRCRRRRRHSRKRVAAVARAGAAGGAERLHPRRARFCARCLRRELRLRAPRPRISNRFVFSDALARSRGVRGARASRAASCNPSICSRLSDDLVSRSPPSAAAAATSPRGGASISARPRSPARAWFTPPAASGGGAFFSAPLPGGGLAAAVVPHAHREHGAARRALLLAARERAQVGRQPLVLAAQRAGGGALLVERPAQPVELREQHLLALGRLPQPRRRAEAAAATASPAAASRHGAGGRERRIAATAAGCRPWRRAGALEVDQSSRADERTCSTVERAEQREDHFVPSPAETQIRPRAAHGTSPPRTRCRRPAEGEKGRRRGRCQRRWLGPQPNADALRLLPRRRACNSRRQRN